MAMTAEPRKFVLHYWSLELQRPLCQKFKGTAPQHSTTHSKDVDCKRCLAAMDRELGEGS